MGETSQHTFLNHENATMLVIQVNILMVGLSNTESSMGETSQHTFQNQENIPVGDSSEHTYG